jgi:tyrosine-protein phosphatase YwqE
MKTNLTVGTEIYYTGDMANSSARCKVVSVGRNHVVLVEMDGERVFHVYKSQIGDVYQGHCDPRFVTEEARQAYLTSRAKAD